MKCLATVKNTKQLNQDTFLLCIESEKIASIAKAGQFVNVKCSDGLDAYLRRPISIHSVNRECNTFDIVFQNRGKGTNLLSNFGPGDEIDIIGPLGRGFTLNHDHKHIVIAGGG
ncbi:MAG: dihydroorotate dehydrogenase electron transfer subunit, partial [Clostridiaceae bacterium]|nr:dihydroorotate dehydrogenase electron transfer subunit [Clostridiaceae bacterium]